MSELEEAGQRVAALKVVSDYTKECYDTARTEMDGLLGNGSRWIARTPAGDKLGAVSKSDPAPKAECVDRPAFTAWAEEHYPDQVDRSYEIAGSDREVIEALFEHAPHLLRRTVDDSRILSATLAVSKQMGTAVGPGGETDVPGIAVHPSVGFVSCKPAEDALARVIELFRAGTLSLESLAPPELPDGAA